MTCPNWHDLVCVANTLAFNLSCDVKTYDKTFKAIDEEILALMSSSKESNPPQAGPKNWRHECGLLWLRLYKSENHNAQLIGALEHLRNHTDVSMNQIEIIDEALALTKEEK